MFKIWLVNHGWYSQHEFTSLADAVKYARGLCMDVRIDYNNEPVCGIDVFSGMRIYSEAYRNELESLSCESAK